MKKKKTGLVWFGNDLRVQDNAVLEKAILENERADRCLLSGSFVIQKIELRLPKVRGS